MVTEDRPTMSEERLLRLRPSDIRAVAANLDDSSFLLDLLLALQRLMAGLTKPFASELDDISRIALQLKMAGVWEKIDPAAFAQASVISSQEPVIREFLGTLGVFKVPTPAALMAMKPSLEDLVADAAATGNASDLETTGDPLAWKQ